VTKAARPPLSLLPLLPALEVREPAGALALDAELPVGVELVLELLLLELLTPLLVLPAGGVDGPPPLDAGSTG